jgi:hypothetical protein
MGVRWVSLARSNLVTGVAEARRPKAGECCGRGCRKVLEF